jgi:hypothetical protein
VTAPCLDGIEFMISKGFGLMALLPQAIPCWPCSFRTSSLGHPLSAPSPYLQLFAVTSQLVPAFEYSIPGVLSAVVTPSL